MKKLLLLLVLALGGFAAAVWFVPAVRTWCEEKIPLPAVVKAFLEKAPSAQPAASVPAVDAAPAPASDGATGGEGEQAPKVAPPPDKAKTKTKVGLESDGDDEDVGEKSDKGEDDDLAPEFRGVLITAPAKATWCVTKQIAPVFDASGKPLGNVAGGRFFVIKEQKKNGRDVTFFGNFMPKAIKGHETVRLPAEFTYGMTGSPRDLSKKQRRALRDFYEIQGEAEEYKAKRLKEAGSKSPFFKDAMDATIKFRDKANQFARLKEQGKFSADQEREAHYKLQQLKDKAETLNAKHKTWKDQHPEAAVEPEKDAAYQELISKSEALRGVIPGLAR